MDEIEEIVWWNDFNNFFFFALLKRAFACSFHWLKTLSSRESVRENSDHLTNEDRPEITVNNESCTIAFAWKFLEILS